MKKIISITTFILIAVMWISCDENDGAYYPVPSAFSVNPSSAQTIVKEGKTIELEITAGNVGWWIESNQTWCKISRKYGSGDAKVTLTIDKNDTGSARQAEVKINPTFKLEPVKIAISQQ